jgi:hypothetical protein
MMKTTSEGARRWADALRQEMEQWPAVVVKRAFGMTLIYRGKVVFAALPGTRALYEEDAVLIKFARETPALGKRIAAEKRFAAGTMQQRGSGKKPGEGRKWRIYLLREERDAREVVEWLARAYELAR